MQSFIDLGLMSSSVPPVLPMMLLKYVGKFADVFDLLTFKYDCCFLIGVTKKGKCFYSPIVQRPYGLGVSKTLLRGWQHRQVCILDLGL